MKCVLLVGDLTTGFACVGPFDNYSLAHEYAERHVSMPCKWHIFMLYEPVPDA